MSPVPTTPKTTPVRGPSRPLSRQWRVVFAACLAAAVIAVMVLPLSSDKTATAASPATGFWSTSTVPQNVSASDAAAVELGMKFKSSVSGTVTGARYYKSSANTGTHTASLWSSAGSKLATATFGNETSSGWQTVTFSNPVKIAANTTYVVSYHTPTGHYAYTSKAFLSQLTAGPLSALSGANGVYQYGKGGFPTSSYNSTNYWIDPLFQPSVSPPPATSTAPSPPPATATATNPPPPTSTTAPTGACTTAKVWQNLDACGWPGAATTGYPAGQTFSKTVSGGLTVTADNTVIDGYKVSGGIQVRAQNVVIKNSWVTHSAGGASGTGVININPGYSATIDHNVLDGSNATHTCIWNEGRSMTATANECIGANDGIFSWASRAGVDGTGDNFVIERNWLHAFTTQAANGHVDGFQTEGAKHGVIRHNAIDVTQGQTAAISIWNSRKSAEDILVDDNLLAGGGFTVYAEDYSPSEASPAGGYTVTNVRFTNNKFSNAHYECVGAYGVWFTRGAPSDGWKRTGNVLLETGQKLDTTNPIVNGWTCR